MVREKKKKDKEEREQTVKSFSPTHSMDMVQHQRVAALPRNILCPRIVLHSVTVTRRHCGSIANNTDNTMLHIYRQDRNRGCECGFECGCENTKREKEHA